ncbi:MAG: primosomal protein N' [Candidatus Binatia bacterium]
MLNEENFSLPSLASVAVPIPYTPLVEFTYRIPEQLHGRIICGTCVVVPVSRRKITGIVTSIGLPDNLLSETNIKYILDIVGEGCVFSSDLMRLWKWATNYYLTSPGEMLHVMLPGGIRNESERIVRLKREPKKNRIRNGEHMCSSIDEHVSKQEVAVRDGVFSLIENEILAFLAKRSRVATKTLNRYFPSAPLHKALHRLSARGLIEIKDHLPRRRAVQRGNSSSLSVENRCRDSQIIFLSSAQTQAVQQIDAALQAKSFRSFLLYGVTGSGKTEVYLHAADHALAMGKSVLILVPEIALTSQLVERVEQRFGAQVAVLHSGMMASERWRQWRRIASGEAKIVVGVRSAVFAPLGHLGLIIVDEEHDVAYKQQDGMRYNARDLAVMRGQLASCPVVLGSATPSLESHVNGQTGRYEVITLPERVEDRPLPTVEIVDLRREGKSGNTDAIFSRSLQHALVENYQAGKQSLLFVNRRGYANYLQCHLCGEVVMCPRCSVSLTFHLRGRILRCHYCGFGQSAFDQCPACHESSLTGSGFGTEQVEEALRCLLPDARAARLDRDSVSRRGALEQILKAWRGHEFDVLIGTQMVAKGHDVPNVTLVGVLRADSSLHFPDFRSSERTFQVLTQVSGRAGRGHDPGRVIIQTYVPQHYSLRFAVQHDYSRFATYELRYRKQLGYPPFARMVSIRCEGKDGDSVRACLEHIAEKVGVLSQEVRENTPIVLGPAPAPLERVNGRQRWQILIKGRDRRVLHELVKKACPEKQSHFRATGTRLIIDVDPYDML